MMIQQTSEHRAQLLAAAEELCRMNFWPIPIVNEAKGPRETGWNTLRIRVDDVPHHFANGAAVSGVGILLGTEPRNIVDVDLDAPAAAVAAQFYPGPQTDRVKGRPGNPCSHYLFQVTDAPPRTVMFKDPRIKGSGAMIVEVLGSGKQAILPPSRVRQHDHSVETLEWNRAGQFGLAKTADIVTWAAELSSIALLAKYWPSSGRHEARMALGGALARAEWPEGKAVAFVRAVVQIAQRGDRDALAAVASDTRAAFQKIHGDMPVTGLPRIAELCGDDIATAVKKWLGLKNFAAIIASVTDVAQPGDLLSQHLADLGNAERLIARHGADMRYVHAMNKWIVWDNRRWIVDDGERARSLSQETMRAFLLQAAEATQSRRRSPTSGALVIFDTRTGKKIGEIKTEAGPGGIMIEKSTSRIYVRLRGTPNLGVVDLEKRKQIATWPVKGTTQSYALALDEENHRLFNTSRNPPALIVFDTESGEQIATLESVQGIDDVWYDAKLKRIYASGGRGPGGEAFVDGFIAVYQQNDADHYELIAKVPTRTGTCTSIWVPEFNRLYASAPGTENQEAAILVFEPQQ